MDAIYKLDHGRVLTSPFAAGPWNSSTQHGAAPAALVAWAVENIAAPQSMQVARLTIDLLRPVPVAPLSIETNIIREGRKIQLCSVRLLAEKVEVVRASALRIRLDHAPLPDTVVETPLDVDGPETACAPQGHSEMGSPFIGGVSMGVARGAFREPGPASVWYRADRPILEGIPNTPLMRAALTADFCNGTSAVLDFNKWTFINGDLTINFTRMPVGEWILLDAESWIGPNGAGIASGRLADIRGYFGRAMQSLLIERRPSERSAGG